MQCLSDLTSDLGSRLFRSAAALMHSIGRPIPPKMQKITVLHLAVISEVMMLRDRFRLPNSDRVAGAGCKAWSWMLSALAASRSQ